MKNGSGSLRVRLLVICELLLIIAWVYLLFQWHPSATAVEPFVTPQANIRYATLRTDISRQLQAANEQPPALAFTNDSNTNFGLDAIFDHSDNASPVTSQPPISFGTINSRPLANNLESVPDAGHKVSSSARGVHNPPTFAEPLAMANPPAAMPTPPPACPYRLSTILRGAGRSTVVLVNTATSESLFLNPGQKAGDWLVTDIGSETISLRSDNNIKTLYVE